MKDYKKVEMVAKNAPSGSYAAGCPQYNDSHSSDYSHRCDCKYCERTA